MVAKKTKNRVNILFIKTHYHLKQVANLIFSGNLNRRVLALFPVNIFKLLLQ